MKLQYSELLVLKNMFIYLPTPRVQNSQGLASYRPLERARTEPKRYFTRAKLGRERGGGGGEGRKRLRTNPWILKTSVRQRTELVSGWTSQTLLTCVDHMKKGMLVYKNVSPNEALISRELRQYGENPVVQCRRFGISKCDSATLFSLLSFSDV